MMMNRKINKSDDDWLRCWKTSQHSHTDNNPLGFDIKAGREDRRIDKANFHSRTQTHSTTQ